MFQLTRVEEVPDLQTQVEPVEAVSPAGTVYDERQRHAKL